MKAALLGWSALVMIFVTIGSVQAGTGAPAGKASQIDALFLNRPPTLLRPRTLAVSHRIRVNYTGDEGGPGCCYTQSVSNCTRIEDPGNFVWFHAQAQVNFGGQTAYFYNASAAATVSGVHWSGGLGSSDSWYFYSDSGTCSFSGGNYATNSVTSGHHVRFFYRSAKNWPRGGVHHDFYCSATGKHGSDQYPAAAYDLANWAYYWKDRHGNGDFTWDHQVDRNPSTFVSCGQSTLDDAVTQLLTQTAIWVYV